MIAMLSKKSMLRDLDAYSPDDVVSYWNLRRIGYVIILCFLLEVVNLFDSGVRETPYLMITSLTLVIAAVPLMLLLLWCIKRFDSTSSKTRHNLYLYFWIFVPTIVAFSFFIRDAQMDRPPFNLLIIVGLISMVPILTAKETLLVFILPFLANLAVSMYVGLNVTYILYSVIFCLTGTFITVIVHRQYIFLIHELNYRTQHDPLTHILNRQTGSEKSNALLSVCKRESKPFAVMMIDVDFFKSFNDAKGHMYGDEVLKRVAQAISESFQRDTDAVYRYGGEEFCVGMIVDDHFDSQVLKLTGNIRALNIPAQNSSVSDLLTVSVGIAVSEKKDVTLESLLRLADEQLYVSKNTGRNRVTIQRI